MRTEGHSSFRQNLQQFINEVKRPIKAADHAADKAVESVEKRFNKLKDVFEEKGLALFLLTKNTAHELKQLAASSGSHKKSVDLDVRPLELRKFKTEQDYNRLDRLIVFNKKDNTVSFFTVEEDEKGELQNVEIRLKLKTKNTDKQEEENVLGDHIQGKKITKAEFDTMNQIVVNVLASMQAQKPDDTSLVEIGEMKAVVPIRSGSRTKDSRNTSESKTSEEQDLPGSERETVVTAAEKIQKEIALHAQQDRDLREAGEERREEFLKQKNKVDEEKKRHRERVAEQGHQYKNKNPK